MAWPVAYRRMSASLADCTVLFVSGRTAAWRHRPVPGHAGGGFAGSPQVRPCRLRGRHPWRRVPRKPTPDVAPKLRRCAWGPMAGRGRSRSDARRARPALLRWGKSSRALPGRLAERSWAQPGIQTIATSHAQPLGPMRTDAPWGRRPVWVCGGLSRMDAATQPTRVKAHCLRGTASRATERPIAGDWAGPRRGTCGDPANPYRAEPGPTHPPACSCSPKTNSEPGRARLYAAISSTHQTAANKKPGTRPGFSMNLGVPPVEDYSSTASATAAGRSTSST